MYNLEFYTLLRTLISIVNNMTYQTNLSESLEGVSGGTMTFDGDEVLEWDFGEVTFGLAGHSVESRRGTEGG